MPIIQDESIDNMSIIDFIRYIQHKYYPDMDISFMEKFMAMRNHKEEYIISSDELAKYGVLSIPPSKKSLQKDQVKEYLTQNKFIEQQDYEMQIVLIKYTSGSKERHIYMLKPRTFLLCLINSQNQPKYREYYFLLEECVSYYNEQQLINKSNEIKLLCEKLDRSHADNQRHISKIDELIEEVRSLRKYIDEIREYLRQRAIPPEENGDINTIVIIKNNTHFSYIRGQDKYVKKQSETKCKSGYIKIYEIENVPNGVYLCKNIMAYFIKKKMVKCTRNDFVLVSDEINNNELIEIMKEIFEERLMV